jgi:hypothetical protein
MEDPKEEKVFFNADGVLVTSTRFQAQGETFALSGITSVRKSTKAGNRVGAVFAGGLAAALLLGGISTESGAVCIISAFVGLASWVLWKNAAHNHIVSLKTSSGESKALVSQNSEVVDQVVAALNAAIVYRG